MPETFLFCQNEVFRSNLKCIVCQKSDIHIKWSETDAELEQGYWFGSAELRGTTINH